MARPLYFYVKNAHRGVIPGLNEFVEEYTSEDALAPGGYLSERGLVPLVDAARRDAGRVLNGITMDPKSNLQASLKRPPGDMLRAGLFFRKVAAMTFLPFSFSCWRPPWWGMS